MHGIFYDPMHDEIVVPVALGGAVLTLPGGANGGDPPTRVLQGPSTGIIKIRQIVADEVRGQIFVTVKNNFEAYNPAANRPSPWDPDKTGFIGVWNVTDDGDVPPRGVIKGPASGLVWPAGVAINPASHEVYTIDSVSNALFMFNMPEFFFRPPSTAGLNGQ